MADAGRSIVVVGDGSASGTPDRCELTIGLNVPLLAALAPVAGDALRLHGIVLKLADVEPLLQVARRRAMDDARNRATELAEAAGLRVGPVVTIEEASAPAHFPVFARRAAAGVAASMQPVAVEPGSSQVSVRVIVTYAIEGEV